jgi:Domain of unknown function (DUF4349)/Putative zinc-finger
MNQAIHPAEQEEVMAYLDGELSADRAALLAAHLRECADCEALAESLRDVSRHMAAWTVEAAPAQLAEHVNAALETIPVPRRKALTTGMESARRAGWFGIRLWVWRTAGASVCVLILLALMLPRLVYRSKYQNSGMDGFIDFPTARARKESYAADSNGLQHPKGQHVANSFSVDGQPVVENAGVFENGPLIARTALLSLVVKDFGPVEAAVKGIAARHDGYIADLNSTSPENAARTLTATLRIPAPQLEAALAELKQLGRVAQLQQTGEDVTKQYTDLAARLKNSRLTEERLLAVLRDRTGKMKDILEAEQEVARVRGEIEEMEAEQRGLQKRIDFATVRLSITEEYKTSLEVAPATMGTRFHNAAVEGFRSVIDGVIEFALWLLAVGPSLLVWAGILFFPARWAWRRWKHAALEAPAPARTN